MKITLLGTGTPAPSLKRAGSGYLVDLGDNRLLFDVGPGVCHRLMEAGHHATDVTDLVLSHLHYDHCCDYARLVLTRWNEGSGTIPELRVYGPGHTRRMTSLLFDDDGVFGPDIAARTNMEPSLQAYEARGGVLPRSGPSPGVTELASGDSVERDGWRLRAISVPHAQPYLECLGFRLDTPSGSFAYSGDAGPSRSFARLIQGCDVLVHMTYQISGTEPGPEWLRGAAGHREAAEIAAAAEARTLVVSHVSGQMETAGVRERLIAEMATIYDGNIVWGEDLMDVPLGDPVPKRHTG